MQNPEYADLFNTKVRHYTLKRHTELVCTQFEKYFGSIQLPVSHNLMKFFLSLHDIGKPIAENEGNRNNQYRYTQDIISKIKLTCCGQSYSENDRDLMLALASGDTLGDYFKGSINVSTAVEQISRLSIQAHMSKSDFLYIFMVYYQCDTGAYTQDAGGLRYLEGLFQYTDTKTKIFNCEENLIQMSETYWSKYMFLKQQLQ